MRIALETVLGALWPRRMAERRRRGSSLRGIVGRTVVDTAGWYLLTGRRELALTSRGPGTAEVVQRVHDSVERTLAQRTARLRFIPWIAGSMGWRNERPAGRIDFEQQSSWYGNGDPDWHLVASGLVLFGHEGEWEIERDTPGVVHERDPFWLLQLIAAAEEAIFEGSQTVNGTRCERYLTTASLVAAASQALRPMEPPRTRPIEGSDRFPIELWIDGEGRIRAARLHRGRSWMSLELFDYGAAEPIQLPPSDQVAT